MAVRVAVHQPSPDRTLAVWLDSTPDLSSANSTPAYCVDVKHQPTDLAVGQQGNDHAGAEEAGPVGVSSHALPTAVLSRCSSSSATRPARLLTGDARSTLLTSSPLLMRSSRRGSHTRPRDAGKGLICLH
jgi:hypothetical protein